MIQQQSGAVIGDRLARNGRNCANGHHAKPDADELNRWLSDKDLARDGWPDEPEPGSVPTAEEMRTSAPSELRNNAGAAQLVLLFG